MLKDTVLSKYWDKKELKGLSLKRALAIIQVLEMWGGEYWMMIKENYAQASIKEVLKYKLNWLYKLYLKYIELYDFNDLI